jgi:hypothetical protein
VVPESFLKNSNVVSLRAVVKGEDQSRGSRGLGGGEGGGGGGGKKKSGEIQMDYVGGGGG